MEKITCAFLIVTLIIAFTMPFSLALPEQTKIYVDPPSIIDSGISPSQNITVNVMVADVTDLYSWQVKIHYNATILNVTDVSLPPNHVFAGRNYYAPAPVIEIPGDVNGDGKVDASDLVDLSKAYGSVPGDPNWDERCDLKWDGKIDASDLFDLSKNYGNTEGYVVFGVTLLWVDPLWTFDGTGVLCQISFHVKDRGATPLHFSPYGEDTFLENRYGGIISASTEDGFFDNSI